MQKLISELKRLYLHDFHDDEQLARHLRGEHTISVDLARGDLQRAIVIDFHKAEGEQHWLRLCDVANAIQQELELPAPAVSVSGGDSYQLWLSLAQPLSPDQARQFLALLHKAYFEDEIIDLGRTAVELPPCQHVATGLWAAFINPSMGGALAEDLGLEVTPSESAQAGFLEKLDSISAEAFQHALDKLQAKHAASDSVPAPLPLSPTARPKQSHHVNKPTPDHLLLKDATLEDIVRHLHAMGIEPTFRHVLKD
ncbi:hypothetical protein GJ699_24575 [Duganella sp. FT80W]|uniref:Uncharacterized protein n=1 Tax=Duganella guangzhouensis TaxID=2666084 RepID=A0A6I2L6A1_9BURK|nr:hypothetical protein [Duganella guangzhouensis]MRW93172.1 hypothetical protein [Duganella guangzhouensis]